MSFAINFSKPPGLLRLVVGFALMFGGCAPRATAMEWRAGLTSDGVGAIIASGRIDELDAERLQAIVKKGRSASAGTSPLSWDRHTLVVLHSGGGNVIGGLKIGYLIHKLGFDTLVERSRFCASACTFAFLGGVDRAVEGTFTIHAMSLASEPVDLRIAIDDIQTVSALVLSYTREMTGQTKMAEAAFEVGSAGLEAIPDDLLRDWNIITKVKRSAQDFSPEHYKTIYCAERRDARWVGKIVCRDLGLGRLDARITRALAVLKAVPDATAAAGEQSVWIAFRDGCEAAYQNGFGSSLEGGAAASKMRLSALRQINKEETGVQDCLEFAYEARAKELEARVAYWETVHEIASHGGWKKGP
ncbi:hypothetical protein [Methylosinus sp. PW1]|uniref:hypothetical protein n=1 Tax=Methylosinus sp. PW1 TaxID=107636 RepID=UPI000AC4C0B9|nr:hypothetical protein [Methylosinus sp. PW1]